MKVPLRPTPRKRRAKEKARVPNGAKGPRARRARRRKRRRKKNPRPLKRSLSTPKRTLMTTSEPKRRRKGSRGR